MIDLCMEDYTQAIAFGRRGVEVYILDWYLYKLI
jgi:3D (Asp-Asp-Asp) domain-containing protein